MIKATYQKVLEDRSKVKGKDKITLANNPKIIVDRPLPYTNQIDCIKKKLTNVLRPPLIFKSTVRIKKALKIVVHSLLSKVVVKVEDKLWRKKWSANLKILWIKVVHQVRNKTHWEAKWREIQEEITTHQNNSIPSDPTANKVIHYRVLDFRRVSQSSNWIKSLRE